MQKLLKRYITEICPICNNKDSNLCNIKVYKDYKNNCMCCKCVYFANPNKNGYGLSILF